VLVATSCFSLLCEEADIRGGADEVSVTSLVPNYHVYQELAQAAQVLTQPRKLNVHLIIPFSVISFTISYFFQPQKSWTRQMLAI